MLVEDVQVIGLASSMTHILHGRPQATRRLRRSDASSGYAVRYISSLSCGVEIDQRPHIMSGVVVEDMSYPALDSFQRAG
jgi:hypothetical protein